MNSKTDTDTDTETLEEVEIKLTPLYKVIFHDDDKTPIDYVVFVLTSIYGMSNEDAWEVTLKVHDTGNTIVGIYTHEIASDKKNQTDNTSSKYGYPLVVTIEEDI